jgi:small multidrug resistance pump
MGAQLSKGACHNAPRPKEKPMSGYLYLAIAIVAEVIATTALKAVEGFSKPLPLILVVVGYGIAFWMLSLVMKSIPVGVTYAIWSGLGIVLISIAGLLIYGQKLDLAALAGIGLIIAGVLVIQLFSGSTGH